MSLFMGFWRGFVHRFLWICSWVSGVWVGFGWRLGGVWVGIWVVGFRFDGCDFFRWVGGFVPIGLMVGLGVCWVCLVVGFNEDDDDDKEELVVSPCTKTHFWWWFLWWWCGVWVSVLDLL